MLRHAGLAQEVTSLASAYPVCVVPRPVIGNQDCALEVELLAGATTTTRTTHHGEDGKHVASTRKQVTRGSCPRLCRSMLPPYTSISPRRDKSVQTAAKSTYFFEAASRKPRLLNMKLGANSARYADRTSCSLLRHEPPRAIRLFLPLRTSRPSSGAYG